jgi:hypothetical protein
LRRLSPPRERREILATEARRVSWPAAQKVALSKE